MEDKNKKRKKGWFVQTGQKRSFDGKKGILITCNKNTEKMSMRELFNLFSEYAEKLYPDLDHEISNANETEQKDTSIEEELQKEIEELKNEQQNKGTKKKNFESYDTGCSGMWFMAINSDVIEPVAFVKSIFDDIEKTKETKTRFTHRMIPVSNTCVAKDAQIMKMAKQMVDPIFNSGDPPKTFAILAKTRNNNDLKKMLLIKDIFQLVNHDNKVDLKNPEWSIIVEVIKKTCCMCITQEYNRYRKFNIRFPEENVKKATGKRSKEEMQNQNSEEQDAEPKKLKQDISTTESVVLESKTIPEALPQEIENTVL